MLKRIFAVCLCAVGSLALMTAGGDLMAAPRALSDASPPAYRPPETPTADTQDRLSIYLAMASPAPAASSAYDGAMLYDPDDLTVIPRSPRMVLHAPSEPGPQPSPQLASFTYPVVTGLADTDNDERAIPLSNTTMLTLSPGGFGRVMTGRPTGAIANWSDAAETSISYIRPHVAVEMMMALEIPGPGAAGEFEGPGMAPHAYLDVDHRTKVNSADIGSSTNRFGLRPSETPVDEPQTAVSVGLDLGILPTFLSQMGMSVSVVAARGKQTGNTRIALVGTTELPVDWTPRERPISHPRGLSPEAMVGMENSPLSLPSGGTGSGGSPGGGGAGGRGRQQIFPTPPPVPEPATLSLLAVAAGAALAGRKIRRK